jgi:hypothetical protein
VSRKGAKTPRSKEEAEDQFMFNRGEVLAILLVFWSILLLISLRLCVFA